MSHRKYAFAVGEAVTVLNGPSGKVLTRAADPDHVSVVEVSPKNIKSFEGKRLGDHVEVAVPVNAYQVEFTGDNGRPDSAWWQEDMLEAARA